MYPADVVLPPQCHAISFFEDQEQLCDDIATFIAEGLNVGEPALIVTNEAHRTGIVDELRARGIHAAERIERGDLLLLDAEEILNTLIKSDGLPDAALYHEHVGTAVKQLLDGRPGPVRIFGDMVDLRSNAASTRQRFGSRFCRTSSPSSNRFRSSAATRSATS